MLDFTTMETIMTACRGCANKETCKEHSKMLDTGNVIWETCDEIHDVPGMRIFLTCINYAPVRTIEGDRK